MLAVALVLGAVVAAWAPLVPWRGVFPTRIWHGYRPLLVHREPAWSRENLALISRTLGPGAISATTAAVEFWDFSSRSQVTVADLSSRLDPMDPRFDPWMAGVGRYFLSPDKEWVILYLPAVAPALVTWLRATAALGIPWQGQWMLPDLAPVQTALSLLAVIALAILPTLSLGRNRRRVLAFSGAAAVLSMPLVCAGGFVGAASAVLLLAAWLELLRILSSGVKPGPLHLSTVRGPVLLYLAGVVLGSLLLLYARLPSSAPLLGFAGLSVALLLLLSVLEVLPRQAGIRRRPVFEPVRIVRSATDRLKAIPVAPAVACLLLLGAAASSLAGNAGLPLPAAVRGARGFSWESMSALARFHRADDLPGLVDLVTHDAYQETIAFGRPWRMPSPGERVTVREYLSSPGSPKTVERLRTVKTFDAAWLRSVRSRAPTTSIEALLFAQRRPVAASAGNAAALFLAQIVVGCVALVAFLAVVAGAAARRPLIRPAQVRFNVASQRSQAP